MEKLFNNKEAIDRLELMYEVLYHQYINLSRLEVDNQGETNQFRHIIDKISLTEGVAEKIFHELDLSKWKELMDYVIDELDDIDFSDDFDSVITNTDLVIVKRKLLNKIAYKELVRKSIYGCEPDEDVFADASIYGTPLDKIKILTALEVDTINRFIYYLEQELQREENRDIRKRIGDAKYNTIYINRDLLDGSYELKPKHELVISARLVAENSGMSSEQFEILNNDNNNVFRYSQNISRLLDVSDKHMQDENNKISALLRICLIKACLTGYSLDTIEHIEKTTKKLFDSKEFASSYSDSSIAKDMLSKALEDVKKDRDKIIIK